MSENKKIERNMLRKERKGEVPINEKSLPGVKQTAPICIYRHRMAANGITQCGMEWKRMRKGEVEEGRKVAAGRGSVAEL